MDKNLANYIKTAYGFIVGYTTENGKIEVYTAKSKKNEPHTYDVKYKKKYDNRLGEQYTILHSKKEEIKQDISKKARKKVYAIGGTLAALAVVAGVVANIVSAPITIPIIGLILGGLVIGVGEAAVANWQCSFDREINAQIKYLKERERIEEASKQDENITKYLSEEAKTTIKSKETLQAQGVETEVFDIDFMDKVSYKDLKSLIDRYLISQGLSTQPTYQSPENISKSRTKKRVRIKED